MFAQFLTIQINSMCSWIFRPCGDPKKRWIKPGRRFASLPGVPVTAQLKSASPLAQPAEETAAGAASGSTPMMMTSLTAMPLMYIAANKGQQICQVSGGLAAMSTAAYR